MDKFGVFCWLFGYAALCGIVIMQHFMLGELDDRYQVERAISDMAVRQAAACYISKRRYINVGGYDGD